MGVQAPPSCTRKGEDLLLHQEEAEQHVSLLIWADEPPIRCGRVLIPALPGAPPPCAGTSVSHPGSHLRPLHPPQQRRRLTRDEREASLVPLTRARRRSGARGDPGRAFLTPFKADFNQHLSVLFCFFWGGGGVRGAAVRGKHGAAKSTLGK